LIVAFIALYDACVLYPALVRDVLMHLTTKKLRAPSFYTVSNASQIR
jgi:hypothetical protein